MISSSRSTIFSDCAHQEYVSGQRIRLDNGESRSILFYDGVGDVPQFYCGNGEYVTAHKISAVIDDREALEFTLDGKFRSAHITVLKKGAETLYCRKYSSATRSITPWFDTGTKPHRTHGAVLPNAMYLDYADRWFCDRYRGDPKDIFALGLNPIFLNGDIFIFDATEDNLALLRIIQADGSFSLNRPLEDV